MYRLIDNHYQFPLKQALDFHLNKLKTVSLKYAFCQIWLKLGNWFWKRRSLNVVNVLPSYLLHSLAKGRDLYFGCVFLKQRMKL